MGKPHIEPGLLQVFRLYNWLHLASLLLVAMIRLHWWWNQYLSVDILTPVLFTIVYTAILLGLLYWGEAQQKLGRLFVPLALVLATLGLSIEQYLFMLQGIPWQSQPFLYVLLIFVAWQYSFPQVILFTLAVALFEFALNTCLSPPVFLPRRPGPVGDDQIVFYWMPISRSAMFLLLGYVVTRLVDAQRQQRRALAEANQKLINHAATLEQLTITRERVRLSRELHDTLAHTLSALTVQIEAILTRQASLPVKVRQILEKMQEITRSGLDETRRALSALRASPLEEMGLAAALRVLVEDFAERNRLTLEASFPDHIDDLPSEVEQCYYRVAQEALENVARHANAQRLTVTLEQKMGVLSLRIRDDGSGFLLAEKMEEEHLGLKGMEERASLVGAELTILSQPGWGTTVDLRYEVRG
jgi:signal transduction histidine kinase